MESLREILSHQPPIIARTRRGELTRGHLLEGKRLLRGELRMTDRKGTRFAVKIPGLKAVFFVHDFDGDSDYLESKTLTRDPERKGLRVRLRFEDNETLEGVVENSVDMLPYPGFFFWPCDPDSNNRLVYVSKAALLGFTVLSVRDR